MGKMGNVLVIGNSGVGKSTLINAVLGDNRAETSFGGTGTTKKLSIYESKELPFRIIDTIGFEPSWIKERQAIQAVKKWLAESAKKGREDTQVNVIWFCVEGTSSKLFPKAIQDLSRATSMWPTVPLIVVITKSYSKSDREKNVNMVHNAFASQKRYGKNLCAVIPVVAEIYEFTENAFVPVSGIQELIEKTNGLLPEGIKAAQNDVHAFALKRKQAFAQSVITVATAAGVAVGAVPIPFPDATLLGPVEVGEVNALAGIYGINKNEKAKGLLNSIIEAGTVGAAAKALISGLKLIPGLTIGAAMLNAIIAGSIVAALGEASNYIFIQIFNGEKSVEDIDWAKKILESRMANQALERAKKILDKVKEEKLDKNAIVELIMPVFFQKGS